MKHLACCLLLTLNLFGYGQSAQKISGKIITENNEPLLGATVLLLEENSDAVIKATSSGNSGDFTFDYIKVNKFRISAQYVGFEKFVSKIYELDSEDLLLPDIVLKESSEALNEVNIIAKKPFVEQKIDRIIINPDALISNAGVTAFEVLEKVPGVNVDLNENISIIGKSGVVIFINDKPSYLSASDLASYLRSIASSDIHSIEVMTNPPAKYDASGNAGIINIKLKKNIVRGFNGGVNLSYGQGRFMRTNNSVSFNYRIQKWNFFSNAGFNKNDGYQDLTITRRYFAPLGELNSIFTQNSYITSENNSNSLRLGTDFYATDKTTFGIVLSGFLNPSNRYTKNNATIQDGNLELINRVEARNPMDIAFKNGSINLNMSHKINDQGEEISVNVDNIVFDSEISQSLSNKIFTPDGTLTDSSLLNSDLPAEIYIKAGQIDYSGIKVSGGKIDSGIKGSYVKTKNVADFFDVIDGESSQNFEFSNDFTYRENIYAIYSNYSKEYKKISVQAGLRIEHTNIKGYQAGNVVVADSTFRKKYTNLFPTFYVQYRIDSLQNNIIGLSVGRRINRPNYRDLNPFTYPMDRFTFYGGNPFLEPTLSYNIDLSHTYKRYLTTTLTYSYVDNLIFETNEQRGEIYYSRPGNFARQISYGLSVNGTFHIRKWWTLQLYAMFMNNGFESKVYTESLDDSRWYWAVSPTNQFSINEKWSIELAGNYQSKILFGQFLIMPRGSVRAGISTKILNNQGTIRANISDIFYTNQMEGQIRNISNAQASWFSYLDSRVVSLAFSYRFSKGDNLRVRKSGSSESEQSRVNI